MFLDIDNPTIRGKCKSGGASVHRYKRLFCLRCMVSYSNDHLHVCEGRCIRCLSTTDEHVDEEFEDEIVCANCGRLFLQRSCFELHKTRELNGLYGNYCDFYVP